MQLHSILHKTVNQSITASFVLLLLVGCGSQKTAGNAGERNAGQRGRGERPSVEEIFRMDTNNDGKLAKSELEGPLLRDFATIDSNRDGFITRTELENAPQPQRGQGPPR